uniref:Uncharacterized protein n=1 Tax=Anguilla anguilla TaxID=7936 RepID=A0A0E9TJC2_ANGAN
MALLHWSGSGQISQCLKFKISTRAVVVSVS